MIQRSVGPGRHPIDCDSMSTVAEPRRGRGAEATTRPEPHGGNALPRGDAISPRAILAAQRETIRTDGHASRLTGGG